MNDLNETLIRACKDGNLSEIKVLVDEGADVNYQNSDGYTPLMKVCEHCQSEVFHYITQFPLDINAQNSQGETALMLASSSSGCEYIVQDFILKYQYEIRIKLQDYYGRTAYDRAKADGRDEIVAFYEKHFDLGDGSKSELDYYKSNDTASYYHNEGSHFVNSSDKRPKQQITSQPAKTLSCQEKNAALLEYIRDKDLETIEAYLAHNQSCIDVPVDSLGHTLLMVAAQLPHNEEAVLRLIQNGANVNLQNHEGATALLLAIEEKRFNAMIALLKNRADPNLCDQDGFSPLMMAITTAHSKLLMKIVPFLLSYRADLHHKMKTGKSVLDIAKRRGETELITYLEDLSSGRKEMPALTKK